MHPSPSPLKYLGPQWFAVVMGWGGLGLAWWRSSVVFPEELSRVLSAVAGAVAFAVYLLLIALNTVRLVRHRDALREDLAHPVRHAFAGAFPVSTILLCALLALMPGASGWAKGLFVIALVIQAWVTVWVVSGWIRRGLSWPRVTPVVMIPIVGNVLVPLAGVPLGFETVSLGYLAVGLLMWPVVLALLLVRSASVPLPEPLLPSWFILIAPPAITGPALLAFGAPGWMIPVSFGVALFFFLCSLTLVPRLGRLKFGMPFWALSFPCAALSALTSFAATRSPALIPVAQILMLLVTGLILWLSVQTIRGLAAGRLLVAEPTPSAPASGIEQR